MQVKSGEGANRETSDKIQDEFAKTKVHLTGVVWKSNNVDSS